jgi:hypothetical protein
MSKVQLFAIILSVGLLALVGCTPAEDKKAPADSSKTDGKTSQLDTTTTLATLYCGACGEAKGSENCCATGAETCATCGLHAGSALCCVVEGDLKGKDICAKCGHIAGSTDCCNPDHEKCAKCGLDTDSPLHCKLTTAASTSGSEAAATN